MSVTCRVNEDTKAHYAAMESVEAESTSMETLLEGFMQSAFDDDRSTESQHILDFTVDAHRQIVELLLNNFPLDITPMNYQSRMSERQQEVFIRDALAIYCTLNNKIIEFLES